MGPALAAVAIPVVVPAAGELVTAIGVQLGLVAARQVVKKILDSSDSSD
jgi:hypothetical protein